MSEEKKCFRDGYSFVVDNVGYYLGAFYSDDWMFDIDAEITSLENNLNSFEGYGTASNVLGGDAAEFFHAGTYNINNVIEGYSPTEYYVNVNRSHSLGSADMTTSWGDEYGSKYYSNAIDTSKQHSKSFFEAYKESKFVGTYEEYMLNHGFSKEEASYLTNKPIYGQQNRLFPTDQLKESQDYLSKRIGTEGSRRPEQVNKFQDTLNKSTDRIVDPKGTESDPLSKKESTNIAKQAKEGNIKAEDIGISIAEKMKFEDALREAIGAGANAATISLALRVAPEIYKAIDYLIKNGELDPETFKRIGFAAIDGAAKGFIRGSAAAAVSIACQSGALGESLMEASAPLIASVTIITINTLKSAYLLAIGKIKPNQMIESFVRSTYSVVIATRIGVKFAQVFTLISSQVVALGFFIGSFIGAVLASFTYDIAKQAVLCLCKNTGFTMFGLVNQDYSLPQEILLDLGLEGIELSGIELSGFETSNMQLNDISTEGIQFDSLDIKIMERGLIGVSTIGYACT